MDPMHPQVHMPIHVKSVLLRPALTLPMLLAALVAVIELAKASA